MMGSKKRLIIYGAFLAAAIPVLAVKARKQTPQGQLVPQGQQGQPAPQAQRAPQPTASTYAGYLEIWRQPTYHSQITEKNGLAAPFKGITTDGKIVPGLFSIKSTGVSTEPVRKAAEAYLASLTPEQRQRTMFPLNDEEWRKWENIDDYYRQGVGFFEMTDQQREAGMALLLVGLSAKGLKMSRDIMKLNYELGEMGNNLVRLGEWNYFITVMGTPSATQPWGWQIDGHHLVVNYFVLGDQVVMSPAFFGAEPTIADSGKYAGTQVLQVEQQKGLEMIHALNDEQRKRAITKE